MKNPKNKQDLKTNQISRSVGRYSLTSCVQTDSIAHYVLQHYISSDTLVVALIIYFEFKSQKGMMATIMVMMNDAVEKV